MPYRPEFIEALRLLAIAFDRTVEQHLPRPILVGGAAVEFYTGGSVTSGDFDVISENQTEFESILVELGFKREDRPGRLTRGLYHPNFSIGVEVVSSSLFDGASDLAKVRLVEVEDGHSVAVVPVEDLIADRLAQYCAGENRVPEMLDQAVKLFEFADNLDEVYLDRRILSETLNELDLAFLKANLP